MVGEGAGRGRGAATVAALRWRGPHVHYACLRHARSGGLAAPRARLPPEPAVPRGVVRAPLLVLAVVELAIETDDSHRVGWLRPHAGGEPPPLELSAVDCEEAVAAVCKVTKSSPSIFCP